MNEKIISRCIQNQLAQLTRLESTLQGMREDAIANRPQLYEKRSTDAALRAESVACHLRELLYVTTTLPKKDYLTRAADTHGIAVHLEDGIFQVTLPRLLPKKRQRTSGTFLLDPIHYALEQYGEQHLLPHYQTCVVCIEHLYNDDLSQWCLHDYDNNQQKQVLDMIALYVMADDSSPLCDVYNTVAPAPHTCTRISVMEKEQFLAWLAHKSTVKTVSDFPPLAEEESPTP